ncbi:MAG: hypothetical protein EOO20_15445 [Chryseobacterium sp.]|nr:MAG: hypothetical protein EOO20_15445 [Chryseobacterium sp.]
MSTVTVQAQSYFLKFIDEKKPFSLYIYHGPEGKGAFVQYYGRTGLIALKLDKIKSQGSNYYKWIEKVNGKQTGVYELTEKNGKVLSAWYDRESDHRRFMFSEIHTEPAGKGVQKMLVNNVLITYNTDAVKSRVYFSDVKGVNQTLDVDAVDALDAQRKSYIVDYNFDGYDDVAFSVPDAGMGVYRTFNIWLYNPKTKQYDALQPSMDERSKCSCLCDVSLDKKNKLIMTSCRGGAQWWEDTYRITKSNQLVWVRSKPM